MVDFFSPYEVFTRLETWLGCYIVDFVLVDYKHYDFLQSLIKSA